MFGVLMIISARQPYHRTARGEDTRSSEHASSLS